jgi:hypothetical protein
MSPSDLFDKTILISPLNWGMGHVSRCIPLIKKLAKQNNQIFIACSDSQRIVFESYFEKDIVYINHEGYPFRFNGRGNFILDSIFNLKKLKKRHESELYQVSKLVDEYGIEIIISDHRYGFRSENCVSIFMTHQLILPLPWYLKIAQYWHKKQVSEFNFQWIVDDEIHRLAGKLSSNLGFTNSRFIGHLSRFNDNLLERKKHYNGVLIISGPPEYYSSLFESFKSQLNNGEIDLVIGNDIASEVFKNLNSKIAFHQSRNWTDTDKVIFGAKKIFGYFGYSTLMDLKYLNCESELIACPGQLEQLYLQKKS